MTFHSKFGQRRIYYNNFADHLLNAYNPNMLYPGLPYRWTDEDWRRAIDMLSGFGFNAFEFWLVPRLFCREGLQADWGKEFARHIRLVIGYAQQRGMKSILLCGLATSGQDWRTLCPNIPAEWAEILFLWDAWTRLLPEVDIVAIFPGDPGACSRNGCTAETYIDRSIDVAHLVKRNLPQAEIDFGTWGPPFFGWGNIKGPENWQGEFIAQYQATAWDFDPIRAEKSMTHLIKRLPDFPDPTAVSINLGFDSDGKPDGPTSAISWAREIARTHRIQTWDFSLTEGENAILPHFRFERLFAQRKREREAAPYSGGICFTMSPLLNQLSLYESAQSFLDPDADPLALTDHFYTELFGPGGSELVSLLPLFEIIPDWGNYAGLDLSRGEFNQRINRLVECLQDLQGQERQAWVFHPSVPAYREELLFFARLFSDLSSQSPDYDRLWKIYWEHVYRIYDSLPTHVDPRPRQATDRLILYFQNWK